MFSVGDKVVHPGGTTLTTPVAQAENVGLRPALSDAQVKRLLRALKEPPNSLSFDFRERQTIIEERLKETDVFVTAEVLRDMTWYGQSRGLTKRDTQLLQRAEDLIAGELALIWDVEVSEATEQVQAVLTEAIREQADT
jgi:RNA polymerase-interacting CarD/CdnL/TRCF family regulator